VEALHEVDAGEDLIDVTSETFGDSLKKNSPLNERLKFKEAMMSQEVDEEVCSPMNQPPGNMPNHFLAPKRSTTMKI